MSPSLALKAIYTTCQKLNLVPKGLLAFKPKCMIMTGPADRLSWFSTSVLVFGCRPIELISRNPSIYNMINWVAWTMGQTKRLMFQVLFFFIISCKILYKILYKNPFNLFFYFLKKLQNKEF